MAKSGEKALIVMPPTTGGVQDGRKGIDEIITNSSPMAHIVEMVLRIAPSNLSILITGESGVGKQVVAEAIHTSSGRKGAFVDTHCAAFSPTLLEDELFGHEKGAFTGAITSKKGIFEKANGGTLFLDEIGEIDPSVQVKLLKVLEEKKFMPLGSDKEIKSDFRLVSATNRDLKKEVEEGRFREDLYYRINKMNLDIPPLRERKSDIVALASSFLERYSRENKKNIQGFTEETAKILLTYKWPGNIRELQNVIEASTVLADGSFITKDDLPMYLQHLDVSDNIKTEDIPIIHSDERRETIRKEDQDEPTTIINKGYETQSGRYVSIKLGTLKEMERDLIKATLDFYGGNKTQAAIALGVNRKTLANNS